MKIVVPLAGPDFERDDGGVKATIDVDGEPLLRRVLEGRPWWNGTRAGAAGDLIFVLQDTPTSGGFARDCLKTWYPGCTVVLLSRFTRGAALSALAGLATIQDVDDIICVDLVDIDYRSTLDPLASFAAHPQASALALTFPSDNPVYSYLRTDDTGRVVEAAEKRVISRNASAGTYFFRNAATYIMALAHSLENADLVTHHGLFFVCPLFNGVISNGGAVMLEPVDDVLDIKVPS